MKKIILGVLFIANMVQAAGARFVYSESKKPYYLDKNEMNRKSLEELKELLEEAEICWAEFENDDYLFEEAYAPENLEKALYTGEEIQVLTEYVTRKQLNKIMENHTRFFERIISQKQSAEDRYRNEIEHLKRLVKKQEESITFLSLRLYKQQRDTHNAKDESVSTPVERRKSLSLEKRKQEEVCKRALKIGLAVPAGSRKVSSDDDGEWETPKKTVKHKAAVTQLAMRLRIRD